MFLNALHLAWHRGAMCCLLGAAVLALAAPPAPVHAQNAAARDSAARDSAEQDTVAVEIRFLNVGQADATLIRTADSRWVLIDAGRSPRLVAALLEEEGIDTLDLVIASHSHADHIGGLPEVVRRFSIRNFLDNGEPSGTATFRRLREALEQRGTRALEPQPRMLSAGATKFRILSLPPRPVRQNDASVGVVLEYGAFRALFAGDAECRELAHWLLHDSISPVAVLKVSHHGARNGTSWEWAQATRPAVAVISVGRNGFGHPSPRALAIWETVAAYVIRTDIHGTVTVRGYLDGRAELILPGLPPIVVSERLEEVP